VLLISWLERFGSSKLPYNQQKSWAGSISMFVFGLLISIGCVGNQILYQNLCAIYGFWHSHENYLYNVGCCITIQFLDISNWIGSSTAQKVALVSLAATVVESLPTTEVVDDNISVPLASMAAAFLIFGF